MANLSDEILKLDIAGGLLLKAAPYTQMHIYIIQLSDDLTKLLVAG